MVSASGDHILKNVSGVYKITCLHTGNIYIGSSFNIKKRRKEHRGHLNRNTHHSRYLQNSWNKYGAENFKFEILIICDKHNVLFYEQQCLDLYKPKFNTALIAGNIAGVKRTEQQNKELSRALRDASKKYKHKGQMLCLSDIADMENFNTGRLISRVLGLGKTVEEALNMEYKNPKTFVEYEGQQLTVKDLATLFDMNPRRVSYWLAEGLTPYEFEDRMKKQSKDLSFAELCSLFGINSKTVTSRRKSGIGLFEALTTPPKNQDNEWRKAKGWKESK